MVCIWSALKGERDVLWSHLTTSLFIPPRHLWPHPNALWFLHSSRCHGSETYHVSALQMMWSNWQVQSLFCTCRPRGKWSNWSRSRPMEMQPHRDKSEEGDIARGNGGMTVKLKNYHKYLDVCEGATMKWPCWRPAPHTWAWESVMTQIWVLPVVISHPHSLSLSPTNFLLGRQCAINEV